LIALALVFTALFVANIVTGVLLGGPGFPSPFAPADQIQQYFTGQSTAVMISGFFQFGSAVPLVLFTATAYSRLRYLGINAAGASIALVGGLLASAFMALSGLLHWALSRPELLEPVSLMRALHLLTFLTGGVGHVVPLGLLLAGVSVTSGYARLLPRWVVWLGLVIAVIAELSTLSLVVPVAAILLPMARFPAFVWLIAVGATMPRRRAA
jgi:hypothetical protein